MTTECSDNHIIPISIVPTELLEEIREHTKSKTREEVIRDAVFFVNKLMKLEKRGQRIWVLDPTKPLEKPTVLTIGETDQG